MGSQIEIDPSVPIDEYVRIVDPGNNATHGYYLMKLIGTVGRVRRVSADGNYFVDIEIDESIRLPWGGNIIKSLELEWIQPIDRTFLRTGEKAQWIFGVYRRYQPITPTKEELEAAEALGEQIKQNTYEPFWHVGFNSKFQSIVKRRIHGTNQYEARHHGNDHRP